MVRRSVCRGVGVLSVVVALAAGCAGSHRAAKVVSVPAPKASKASVTEVALITAAIGSHPECDPLDTTSCLLPFPSDRFTRADASTPTKRRVALPTGQFANVDGSTLDPTEWNRNDGFSPGTPILVHAPGVDLAKSGLPTLDDIGGSLSGGSASVLVDMNTGTRLAHWTELDGTATNDATRLLILHPAADIPEGHHVVVGLRHLRDASGVELTPSAAFRAYRDRATTSIASVEDRRPALESDFAALGTAGVERAGLWLAWDFTLASERSLSARMLAIRDDAFARLGSAAPAFRVDEVRTDKLDPGIARLVRGSFTIPSYLTGQGDAGSRFHYDDAGVDALPTRSGVDLSEAFSCQIPERSISSAAPSRMVVYGHGLLGDHGEVENSQVAKNASTNGMIYCATDWIGMSSSDVGNALAILHDVSRFPALADRSQQGILDTLFLARVMIHPKGFASSPAFQRPDGSSVVDPTTAYFDGNSQGAIMGGAATAVAQDWTKAVLGVPGMNYSTLLSRSVDFSSYFAVLGAAYPDRVDQEIGYGLLQMLWDRAETNGYAQHITSNPYPHTPAHQVVLDVAFGDHQVSNITAETEARTIGARIRQPALADGRDPESKPYYGLTAPTSYPTNRSLLVYWDSGTLPYPLGNSTPTATDAYRAACGSLDKTSIERDPACSDPHEDPRRAPQAIAAKDSLFRPNGTAVDPCDAKPCTATPRALLDY